MKISGELIRRCSSRHLLPDPQHGGEGGDGNFRRITHLYLQEQHVRKIENLECCGNLLALYLYDNRIERMENMGHLARLSCLHLQGNRIRKMENLGELKQLTVLNLSRNAICRLEGLSGLCQLRELYLEYQRLPDEQSELEVEPDSVDAVADSLQVLNVSGTGLRDLHAFRPCARLQGVQAEENRISELAGLAYAAGHWPEARKLRLASNPVCKHRKYRDSMLLTCLELEELDGRSVSAAHRNFLLNWQQCRALQELKKESYERLRPYLQEQIHNHQLTPPSSRQSSVSSVQSEGPRTRARSAQRRAPPNRALARARSLQEVPRKLIKKLTRSKKA